MASMLSNLSGTCGCGPVVTKPDRVMLGTSKRKRKGNRRK